MNEFFCSPMFDSLKAEIAPQIIKIMGQGQHFVDYDAEADVLYLSFQRPQKATDSQMLDNGVLLRYLGDELVGITILDPSKRGKAA